MYLDSKTLITHLYFSCYDTFNSLLHLKSINVSNSCKPHKPYGAQENLDGLYHFQTRSMYKSVFKSILLIHAHAHKVYCWFMHMLSCYQKYIVYGAQYTINVYCAPSTR